MTNVRDPGSDGGVRSRSRYESGGAFDARMRAAGRGHHGVLRFLLFLLIAAGLVLLALLTIGRPLLSSAVIGWADDNPSALKVPFVADLVRENLGTALTQPASDDATEVPFTINDGDTTPAIANRLEEQKLVTDSRAVVYEAFHQQAGDAWRAGLYELRANMTPGEVVSTLQQGPPPDPIVTIGLREGLRLEQITALLEKLHNEQGLQMDPKDFYDLVTKPPADLLKSYPWLHLPNGASLEGFLGPATYRVHPDVTAEDFVRMLLDHFYDTVGTDRLNVPKARGMSFYQVLTLASIVEQEAIVDSERPLIAGVYQNRLAKKMPLSADPTVIYAYDTGKLRNTPFDQWVSYFFWDVPKNYPGMSAVPVPDDLVKYQTYNRAGLIPGPIATPTLASIDAALAPNTKPGYLYFVAKKDGSNTHAFAKTEAEHIANLKKYGYIR